MHSASYQIEYQNVLGTPGYFGKVKTVERVTDHTISLYTVGRKYVERYIHIPHAPFTARACCTWDSFTFLFMLLPWLNMNMILGHEDSVVERSTLVLELLV